MLLSAYLSRFLHGPDVAVSVFPQSEISPYNAHTCQYTAEIDSNIRALCRICFPCFCGQTFVRPTIHWFRRS